MTLRAAVIGVGNMGRHHARNYANISGVELVGIADANEATAHKMAQQHGGQAFSNYEQMLDEAKPDLVTIAVPTVHHLNVAKQAIDRGIHVLLEKSIAFSVEEGQQIIDLAKAAGVCLMVGHIERFKPGYYGHKRAVGGRRVRPSLSD